MTSITPELQEQTRKFIDEFRQTKSIDDIQTFCYVLNLHLLKHFQRCVNEHDCRNKIKSKYHLLYNASGAMFWMDGYKYGE